MARRRGAKKIDFTHWAGASASASAMAAGTVGATLFSAQHLSETLLRLRGNFVAYIDGVQAPTLQAAFGVGIILVPEGTGTTVTWSPLADPDAPWIWTDCFRLGYEEMVADVIDVPGLSIYRSIIDNKAMRIVRNQELQFVAENVTILSAVTANLGIDVRGLFGT